jgi:K+ transporter
MTNRKRVTVALTWALVAMSVAFAVAGFANQDGMTWGRGLALTVTLGIFSWMLSEALETFLEHSRAGNWRAWTTAVQGLVLFAVEVHLVHYGLGWLFGEVGALALYAASAGFSFLAVVSKANFGHTYTEAPEAAEVPALTADVAPQWDFRPMEFQASESNVTPIRGDLEGLTVRLERVAGGTA